MIKEKEAERRENSRIAEEQNRRQSQDDSLPLVAGALTIISMVVGGFIYFLPTIVARIRKKENLQAILVCNIFALPTFGICWVIAMVWAFTDKKNINVDHPGTIVEPKRSRS